MDYKLTAQPVKNYKKEITDKSKLKKILKTENLCRIALCDGDEPYIVPMNYGYKNGSLYLHCNQEGRKLDIIRENDLVCFEVESGVTPPPVHYKCVIGLGIAHILYNAQEVDEALDVLCSHFNGFNWRKVCGPKLREKTIGMRIDILEMTGKQARYDEWAKPNPDHFH